MSNEGPGLALQVGGTLDPQRHIYIDRPEDAQLLKLLLAGEFCNIVSPRQMGKSSLMTQTMYSLLERGVRSISIDLAGELGGASDSDSWYQGIVEKMVRSLDLGIDVEDWWKTSSSKTSNQKILSFFREISRMAPIVIFFDEIDSTLRLSYADDLFAAIRTLYNERSLVPEYKFLTFCLLGVATPNELIKNRRMTPYNIGHTLELRDFDEERDDLSRLREIFDGEGREAREILRRILYWTGGHPYLTLRLCNDLLNFGVEDVSDVDLYVRKRFSNLETLGADVHVRQIMDFLRDRATSKNEIMKIYARVRYRERDEGSIAYSELRLSGLAKVNGEGTLIVRNRIYEHLFDMEWVRRNASIEPARGWRSLSQGSLAGYGLAAVLAIGIVGLGTRLLEMESNLSRPHEGIVLSQLDSSLSTRGTESREPVRVPAGVESFMVEFILPPSAEDAYQAYTLSLYNRESMWGDVKLSRPRNGSFTLVLSRSAFPAGDYRVDLYGLRNGRKEEIATYSMPVVYLN